MSSTEPGAGRCREELLADSDKSLTCRAELNALRVHARPRPLAPAGAHTEAVGAPWTLRSGYETDPVEDGGVDDGQRARAACWRLRVS